MSAPVWRLFVRTVWPRTLQREIALNALSANFTDRQSFMLVLVGPPRTGKTSIIRHLMNLLGDYAIDAPYGALSLDALPPHVAHHVQARRLILVDGWMYSEKPLPVDLPLVLITHDLPKEGQVKLRQSIKVIRCNGDIDAIAAARAQLTPQVWETEKESVMASMSDRATRWLQHNA